MVSSLPCISKLFCGCFFPRHYILLLLSHFQCVPCMSNNVLTDSRKFWETLEQDFFISYKWYLLSNLCCFASSWSRGRESLAPCVLPVFPEIHVIDCVQVCIQSCKELKFDCGKNWLSHVSKLAALAEIISCFGVRFKRCQIGSFCFLTK